MAAEQRKLLGKPQAPGPHALTCPNSTNVSTEQLMGAGASSRHAQLSITDPKICRSYLVGTCPHDLFTNTKQDLGPCPKVHSEPLKSEYEAAQDKSKYGFEYDYMRDMQKYIDECNRRIDAAQRRLEKTPDEIRQTNDLVSLLHYLAAYVFVRSSDKGFSLAQADIRPNEFHQHRPPGDRDPGRIWVRSTRSTRAP